jgi:MoxR-like ATPase
MKSLREEVEEIKARYGIVGRDRELAMILSAIRANRHVLLEGPVGVGKTLLARSVSEYMSRDFIRVDGDERLDENKLIGHWDPPSVLKHGYVESAFVEGPLTAAARRGGILFINELNRLPDSAQNALLPAMDEGIIGIPHLGQIRAKDGFLVIATQNPEESIGVTRLSEALKDRFVLVKLDYQSQEEEEEIVRLKSGVKREEIVKIAVSIARETRRDPAIKRGASVRAAIDMAVLAESSEMDWHEIAMMVLPKRIELREDAVGSEEEVIRRIVDRVLSKEEVFQQARGIQAPR